MSKELGTMGDPLMSKVIEVLVISKFASEAMLQRKFGISFARVIAMMEALEEAGVVGPKPKVGTREVLIDGGPDTTDHWDRYIAMAEEMDAMEMEPWQFDQTCWDFVIAMMNFWGIQAEPF